MAFAARTTNELSDDYIVEVRARLCARKLEQPSDCWLYDGARTRQGYGKMGFGGQATCTHVVSWLTFRGGIPADTDVCHRCNVQACFNPDHLYLAPRSVNVQHAVRDRLTKHHGWRGARIDDASVREIRQMYAAEGLSQRRLARLFRVDQQIVSRIVRRKAFRWVD